MAKDFDWNSDEDGDSVVFPTNQGLAVYANPKGSIVLRQQGYMGEDDSIIIVPRAQLDAVISALRTAAVEADEE